MSEVRTHVTFFYPGSFYPEEGPSTLIDDPSTETVLAASPDEFWFGAEVRTAKFERWTSESGAEKFQIAGPPVETHFVYIGEELTFEDVEALGDEHRILLANMRGNGWPTVCKTRRGNFRPVAENDIVLASVSA